MCILNHNISDFGLQIQIDTSIGKNMIGYFLQSEKSITIQQIDVETTRAISLLKQQNVYQLYIKKLLAQSCNLQLMKTISLQQKAFISKQIKFFKQYFSFNSYKEGLQLLKDWRFNKKKIDMFQTRNSDISALSMRNQTICSVYNKYILNGQVLLLKHICYQLIQSWMVMSDKQFNQQFSIENQNDIENILKLIDNPYVGNVQDVERWVHIAKCIEYARIYFCFSENFTIQQLDDNILRLMFDGVKHRMLDVSGSDNFIIVHNRNSGDIYKKTIDYLSEDEINNYLQKCDKQQLYDVVILSPDCYNELNNMKINYLNYITSGFVQLNLKHPEDIVNMTLQKIKLINLNECVNLRNFCTIINEINKQDIENLHMLQKIYLYASYYERHDICLLQQLFSTNKFKYVLVDNAGADTNVLTQKFELLNTKSLRYLYINDHATIYNLTICTSDEGQQYMIVQKAESHQYQDRFIGQFEYLKDNHKQIVQ